MLTEWRQRLSWRRLLWKGVPNAWSSNRESPATESLTEGTTRRPVPAERSVRRPCRSATGTSGPRYRGALPCNTYTPARQLYIQSAVGRAANEGWWTRQWCGPRISYARSTVLPRSAPTVDGALGRLEGRPVYGVTIVQFGYHQAYNQRLQRIWQVTPRSLEMTCSGELHCMSFTLTFDLLDYISFNSPWRQRWKHTNSREERK